jgi:hypothetical protein
VSRVGLVGLFLFFCYGDFSESEGRDASTICAVISGLLVRDSLQTASHFFSFLQSFSYKSVF